MDPPFDRDAVAAVRQASREHRRNTVARMLAALDLMRTDQIRFCAESAGIDLPNSDDPKILIEAIRRQLMT
ncbi:MAG: hypothetical protein ACRDYA_19030 [Egibacteraceae bacterium]